jgi:hypothetical protein
MYKQMLSAKEFDRWQNAQQAKDVVEIVTLAEALEKSKTKSRPKKHGSSKRIMYVMWHSIPAAVWFGMQCLRMWMERK